MCGRRWISYLRLLVGCPDGVGGCASEEGSINIDI